MARLLQCFPGERAGSFVFHCGDGFFYHVRDIRGNRARLRCRFRSVHNMCYGTASASLETGVVQQTTVHNHFADPLLKDDVKLRRAMLEEARTNQYGTKIKSILVNWKLRIQTPELAARFTMVRMKSALNRARAERYPNIPPTLPLLGIILQDLQHMCSTVDGLDNIYRGVVGSPHDQTVSIIFVSGRMLHFLRSRKSLHCDGTFKKRSKKPRTAQIWNIVTKYGENIIALVRVLMQSRTVVAYVHVLEYLKRIALRDAPELVHCDFERAEMNSWSLTYPTCRVAGCLWHYAVACSSHARELGLAPLAREQGDEWSAILSLCAIPMLPSDLMWDGVKKVWEHVPVQCRDSLKPLFMYMEKEWKPRRKELTVFGIPDRTNNASESDNKGLGDVLPNNPNIWHLIGGFVQLEHLAWCDKVAIEQGRQVTAGKKWKTKWNTKRVEQATRLLISRSIDSWQFLELVKYTIVAAAKQGLRITNDQIREHGDEAAED